MDTIIAIATAVGILKGQTAPPKPPAKPPETVTVMRPEAKAESPQRPKTEWPLDY